jgi:glycosyltransferase involved in cell wall biosynthesis
LVVVLHTWIPPGRAATLKKLWMQRAQSVLAVSKAIQTRCWPSATIIGNPYNDESFGARPEVEREHDFIFLGRLVSDKGVEIALRAFARLVGIDRTRIFTIVGDGPEHSSLERIAAELGITESVRFTGPLRGESLVRTLNAHRFLLVPSLWEEPFGIVALEGMACGCVPIVSDGGGLPDAVGKAGRIFRRGDVDALVEAMEEMLEEPEKAEALRREASTHLATYRIEIIAQRYLDAIMGATKSE